MRKPIIRTLFLLQLISTLSVEAWSIDKDGLLSKYRDKFVVVINDGISTGLCINGGSQTPITGLLPTPNLPLVILGLDDVRISNPMRSCSVEPVHKGEILKVFHVALHFGFFQLFVQNVSLHSVTQGVGGFAHQSLEQGKAGIQIKAGANGKDLDAADALAAHWFKLFDAAADAAKFGNTASGIFVNQVKAGMSFAEVESALGVPQTRVDLGDKVLYKYKDMTVEFRDGKVTDVR